MAKNWIGRLNFTPGRRNALKLQSIYVDPDQKKGLQVACQLNHNSIGLNSELYYHFTKRNRVNTSLNLSLQSLSFELGVSRRFTFNLFAGMGAEISTEGVALNFKVKRGPLKFRLPITLSEAPDALFYAGVVAASALGLLAGWALYKPYDQAKRKRKRERLEAELREHLLREKARHLDTVRVLAPAAQACREREQQKNGLVVHLARYGHPDHLHDSLNLEDPNEPLLALDVTVILQTMVHDSTLRLTPAPKSQLEGLYNPCPRSGVVPKLYLSYQLRGKYFSTVIDDKDEVLIAPDN
eukprot:GILI01031438.1.p1 GENE.GILI01031438.1~~GILI01031438.1.p1  ORF type:complete len:297 (-),score=66.68 GILI01031438.1:223-1113(-)